MNHCELSQALAVGLGTQWCTYSVVQFLQLEKDVAQGVVVCVQFDLARTVEEDIGIAQLLKTLLQPFHVMLQLFEGVKDATVGAELVTGHDLLQSDKVADVDGAGVVGLVVGGVEVDDGALSSYGAHELVHYTASDKHKSQMER